MMNDRRHQVQERGHATGKDAGQMLLLRCVAPSNIEEIENDGDDGVEEIRQGWGLSIYLAIAIHCRRTSAPKKRDAEERATEGDDEKC